MKEVEQHCVGCPEMRTVLSSQTPGTCHVRSLCVPPCASDAAAGRPADRSHGCSTPCSAPRPAPAATPGQRPLLSAADAAEHGARGRGRSTTPDSACVLNPVHEPDSFVCPARAADAAGHHRAGAQAVDPMELSAMNPLRLCPRSCLPCAAGAAGHHRAGAGAGGHARRRAPGRLGRRAGGDRQHGCALCLRRSSAVLFPFIQGF